MHVVAERSDGIVDRRGVALLKRPQQCYHVAANVTATGMSARRIVVTASASSGSAIATTTAATTSAGRRCSAAASTAAASTATTSSATAAVSVSWCREGDAKAVVHRARWSSRRLFIAIDIA